MPIARRGLAIMFLLMTMIAPIAWGNDDAGTSVPPPNGVARITVERCAANPLIHAGLSPTIGNNINGPSVIRAPAWIKAPLGKYYMYFANHGGKFIRLAYADDLQGPWKIYEAGTLRLDQANSLSDFTPPS